MEGEERGLTLFYPATVREYRIYMSECDRAVCMVDFNLKKR